MLKIGLTGGIGCGKTTATHCFTKLGVPVIDADEVSHALVEPGMPALQQIRQIFGRKTIDHSGSLNRKVLRDIIFSNPIQKKKLESILHPLIYEEMQRRLDCLHNDYVILSIPLLLETKMEHFVDRILIIDCPVKVQIERVISRDKLDTERIQSILDSQVTRQQRILSGDDVIDNSGSIAVLEESIKKLHNSYISLCKNSIISMHEIKD
jgi:dephospho-CoA kinase